MQRTPGGVPVAGWLLKARRDVWDVVGAVRQREPISEWRLAPGPRVAMVAVGDPVVLWVTGASGQRPAPGVWAIGTVTGPIDTARGSGEGWIDLEARDQVRPRCPIELALLDRPLTRSELRTDPRFAGAEILRAPRVGNPGVLRPAEIEVIAAHLAGASNAVDAVIDRWWDRSPE